MSEITRVALDAMGGDHAPGEMVKGAVEAVQKRKDIKVLLTGKEDVIRKELSAYTYPEEQIEIVNATEVIETAEPPVKAIRGKKDSSIVVAMKMVKGMEKGKKKVSPCPLFAVGKVLMTICPPVRTVYWKLEQAKLRRFVAKLNRLQTENSAKEEAAV